MDFSLHLWEDEHLPSHCTDFIRAYQAKLVGVVVSCHLQDDDVTELRHQLLVPLRLRQDDAAAADWVMSDNDYLHGTTTLNLVPTCL